MSRHAGRALQAAGRTIAISILIGTINTAVVGCQVCSQLESWENNPDATSAALPVGLLTSALLGLVAYLLRRAPRMMRLVVLIQLAVGAVYVLANHYGMTQYAVQACIPTVIAVIFQAHYTRELAPPPPVPIARARVTR